MTPKLRKWTCSLCLLLALTVVSGPLLASTGDYDKPIKIGWTAWSSAEAVTKMAKQIVEEKMGYDVKLIMSDIGVQYQGLASGSIDLMLMSWLPQTQKQYMVDNGFAKKVVNLGPIYTRAKIGWVVPEYIPEKKLSSIEDMKKPEVKNKLDTTIQGIDPGAGVMLASEKAIKKYGLDDAGYELLASSGAGMTAALARAEKRKDWIVATGWSPHWKFAKWDLRYLKDPKGILGGRERIHCLARKGFYQDVPYEVFEFFSRYSIPLEDLQRIMYEARQSSYKKAAAKYIKEHPRRVNYWITGTFDK